MPEIASDRDLRIAQLLEEACMVMRTGATLDLACWSERYPDLADEMPSLLETLREIDTAASDWRGMAAGVDTLIVESADQGTEEPFEFLAASEQPGELGRLGNYRILELLGSGGMGIVFRAEDTRLHRDVALKVMKPSMAAAKSSRERFAREGQSAARIQNDHIVTIYQVGEDQGIPFLAMQLLEGESLEDRLRREPALATEEVIRVAREVAEGLDAAHREDLIHRDIKPANIWLENLPARENEPPRTRVKILDFGLARAVRSGPLLTHAGAVVGTPAFMAPEQARGEEVDGRCDLFSLGCVMYRMATGRLPFQAADAMAALLAVAAEDPPAPDVVNPVVPAGLSDLIMKCLSKARKERPETARALIDALVSIAQDQTPQKSVVLPSRRSVGASFWVKASAGAALVVALAVAAYQLSPPFRSAVDQATRVVLNRGQLTIEAGDENVEVTIRQPNRPDRTQIIEKNTRQAIDVPAAALELEVKEWPSGERGTTTRITIERGGRHVLPAAQFLAERAPAQVNEATLTVAGELPFDVAVELRDPKSNQPVRNFTAGEMREFAVPAGDFDVVLTPIVKPGMEAKFSEVQLKHAVQRRITFHAKGRESVQFELLAAPVIKGTRLFPGGNTEAWAGSGWESEAEHGDEVRAKFRGGTVRLAQWTKLAYGDFELRFQARLKDGNPVLEVGFRDQEGDGGVVGHRFHISGDWQIHDVDGKLLTTRSTDSALFQKADDHFHDVRIRCRGNQLTVWLAGAQIHHLTIPELPAEGRISFTLTGSGKVEARIKNVELVKLAE